MSLLLLFPIFATEVAVNQVAESDSINTLAACKICVLGQAVELDAATAFGISKIVAFGAVTEVDSATTPVGCKIYLLNQVAEMNAAISITAARYHNVAQAQESDIAQLMATAQIAQQTFESDISMSLVGVKLAMLNRAEEQNVSRRTVRSQFHAPGIARLSRQRAVVIADQAHGDALVSDMRVLTGVSDV